SALVSEPPVVAEYASRAERWALRRGRARRITLFAAIGVVAVAAIAGIVVAVSGRSNSSASTDPGKVAPTHTSTTQKATTTVKPTTTTTRPYVHQPKAVT